MLGRLGQDSAGATDLILIVFAIVAIVVSPHAFDAARRACRVSREVASLWIEYIDLREQNERLAKLSEFVKTPKGREMIVRARSGYLPPDAVLFQFREAARRRTKPFAGLRAVFEKMSQRTAETRFVFRTALWLVGRARNPQFLSSPAPSSIANLPDRR